ncbi:MAG: hypothetical protein WDW38_005059 [Sanguina aurantia]
MQSTLATRRSVSVSAARPQLSRRPVVVRAALDPAIVISATTGTFLALGRFVFLPYQRRNAAYDKLKPKTTGTTFFDDLQKPATFTMSSNDPAGFNLIDVFGWGALGHAVAFGLLAISSLQTLQPSGL